MGWDAFAQPFTPRFEHTLPHGEIEGDPEFRDVAREISSRFGTVDGFLQHGGLDCHICGEMLERATAQSMYTSGGLSADVVRDLAARANWSFDVSSENVWAKESARAFLARCAELGRGIVFSW